MSSFSNTSDLKVGVVDDSPLIRELISAVIEETPGMQICGMAEDPYAAREMIKDTNPDVITLDVEMPKMDGIAFLDKIMKLRPMPVIMVSTLTQKGAGITVQALEIGAIDCVGKPSATEADNILKTFRDELIPKLKEVRNLNFSGRTPLKLKEKGEVAPIRRNRHFDLIGIASSTGGVERLRYLASHIEVNIPPTLVVQHINKMYIESMVQRLQDVSPPFISVKVAQHLETLEENTIYFANNVSHLTAKSSGKNFRIHFVNEPPMNGFIASADYLFNSMSSIAENSRVLGIVISGMGNDGAKGALNLRQKGGTTVGENKNSCLIYGMSRAAQELGAITEEKTIEGISEIINGKAVS